MPLRRGVGGGGGVRHSSVNADTDGKLILFCVSDGHECKKIDIPRRARQQPKGADHRLHTNFHLQIQAGVQETQTRARDSWERQRFVPSRHLSRAQPRLLSVRRRSVVEISSCMKLLRLGDTWCRTPSAS